MVPNTLDFLNIFVEAPGDIIYFLLVISLTIVSISLVATQLLLPMSQYFDDFDEDGQQTMRRYAVAMFVVLAAWGFLMVGAIYSLFPDRDAVEVIPPLERAVSTLVLLIVGWATLTADHPIGKRFSNVIVVLLSVGTVVAYLVTSNAWTNMITPALDFNQTDLALYWAFGPAVLALFGILILILLFRHIIDAPLKLLFFTVLLLSHGSMVYLISQDLVVGHYAGPIRLGFFLAFAILPILFNRVMIGRLRGALDVALNEPPALVDTRVPRPTEPSSEPAPAPPTRRPVTASTQATQLLRTMGMILEATQPSNIPDQIVMTTMSVLQADVGALLRLQDANYADITLARDSVRGRHPDDVSLNLEDHPTLVNAIERQAQRALYVDRNIEEIEDIYTRIGIDQVGSVYFQPLVRRGDIIAILMIAFPYVGREMNMSEVELLKGIGIISSNLLALSYEAQEAKILAQDRAIQAMVEGVPPSAIRDEEALAARQEMQDSLRVAREQVTELSKQVMSLKSRLDHERERIASLLPDTEEGLSVSQRIVVINREQEQLRSERDDLYRQLRDSETTLTGATATSNEAIFNDILDALAREKSQLEVERDELLVQIEGLQVAAEDAVVPEDVQSLLQNMVDENDRLGAERDELVDRLDGMHQRLRELGIEDGMTGLSQLIGQLYEDRAALQQQNSQLLQERDWLLQERAELDDVMSLEDQRAAQIERLQSEIERLATDREAALKNRDKLRGERDDLNEKLDAVKEHRARLLAQVAGIELELNESREEQVELRSQIQELADERGQLVTMRDQLEADNRIIAMERDQHKAIATGDDDAYEKNRAAAMASLRKIIDGLTSERNKLERELSKTRNLLADAEEKLDAEQIAPVVNNGAIPIGTYKPEQPELMVGLLEDLRTPMTSISGYVDLLLGESAGILGEMQRKFLRRVSANVSRLDTMIESLVDVTELDIGLYNLEPRPVDVVHIVEDAITNASIQFREKNLAVDLDIEEGLPTLPADSDSLAQIMAQLLSNAYLVSPHNSKIRVMVKRDTFVYAEGEAPRESLFVAVEDRGGGIQPEDVPRVFARKYKATNPLIEGLGDTGVGLSVAKALVDAHSGRVWVDSELGTGSTFNFAIPLDLSLSVQKED